MSFNHCRFCGDWRDRTLIKYSTRHYAHPKCFLDHRELDELPYYQIEQMPFRLLKDRGLMEEAERLIKTKHVPKSVVKSGSTKSSGGSDGRHEQERSTEQG